MGDQERTTKLAEHDGREEELRRRVDALEAQTMQTYCLYCGKTYPRDVDATEVHRHVMFHCLKHPISELRRLANAVVMDWRRVRPMDDDLAALERWLRTEE